jgi:hypothetical protein
MSLVQFYFHSHTHLQGVVLVKHRPEGHLHPFRRVRAERLLKSLHQSFRLCVRM